MLCLTINSIVAQTETPPPDPTLKVIFLCVLNFGGLGLMSKAASSSPMAVDQRFRYEDAGILCFTISLPYFIEAIKEKDRYDTWKKQHPVR